MVLIIDENQSFALTANVTTPGYQTVSLSGYIRSRRPDGVYIAPLIPQLFYGAQGQQLGSWRQHIPTAGSQVILSRSMGQPSVVLEDLWWRKVSNFEEEVALEALEVKPWPEQAVDWWRGLEFWEQAAIVVGVTVGGIALGYGMYSLSR
ncbi:hypothetical protein ES702_07743 [subsurface metagenome]